MVPSIYLILIWKEGAMTFLHIGKIFFIFWSSREFAKKIPKENDLPQPLAWDVWEILDPVVGNAFKLNKVETCN